MNAMTSADDESGACISLELRDDGGLSLHVEHPVPRPDGSVEVILTRKQTQLLALLLATAEQPASI